MKRKIIAVLLMVAVFAVLSSVVFASADESETSKSPVSYLSTDLITLTQGATLNDGTVDMGSGIGRLYSTEEVEMTSLEMKYTLTQVASAEWIGMLFLMDNTFSGAASWERTAANEYLIWFNQNGFAIQRLDGSQLSGVTSAQVNMFGEHTLKVDLSLANGALVITATFDETKVLEASDASPKALKGGFTYVNNAPQATATISKLNVVLGAPQEAASEKTSYMSSECMEFTQGAVLNDGMIDMGSGIGRIYSKEDVSMTSFEMTYTLTSVSTTEWIGMLFLMDNTFSGAASWERTAANEYLIWFNQNGFALQRFDGTALSGTTSAEVNMFGNHTLKIDLSTDTDGLHLVAKLDGTEVLNAVDAAPKALKGGFTYVNNAPQATSTISAINVVLGELKAVEPQVEEPEEDKGTSYLDDSHITLAQGAALSEGTVTMGDGTNIGRLYSKNSVEMTALTMTYNLVSVAQTDWIGMLFLMDNTFNGAATWERSTPGGEYLVWFNQTGFAIQRMDGSELTGLTSSSVEMFGEHTLKLTFSVEDGVLTIVAMFDGTKILDAVDASPKSLKGGFTFVNNTPQAKASISALNVNEVPGTLELTSSFFDDNKDVKVTDFTEVLNQEGELADIWTGTMNEQVFAEEVTFYKGGHKDNIDLGGVDIVTVATKGHLVESADFILKFNLTCNWGRRDTDWGTLITFRDNNAGVPNWDSSSGNLDRHNYSLLFARSSSEDTTKDCRITLIRYDSNSSQNGLCEVNYLNLNGLTHEYQFGIVNVDENEDGVVDYVWICLTMDGMIIMDYKDYAETKVVDNGGMMIMKHYTRTCNIAGTIQGEEVEEVVIGKVNTNPDDQESGSESESGNSDSDAESDIIESVIESAKDAGCFGSLQIPFVFGMLMILAAALLISAKRRND